MVNVFKQHFLVCLNILNLSHEQELHTLYRERTKHTIWLLHVAICDHHATVASMCSLLVWRYGWMDEWMVC